MHPQHTVLICGGKAKTENPGEKKDYFGRSCLQLPVYKCIFYARDVHLAVLLQFSLEQRRKRKMLVNSHF